jgi:peptidoglycan/LPS O-acetylase OafA/YrhL
MVMLAHVRRLPLRTPFDHALNVFLSGGYAGVDLFFVLSGFLITGVLLDAKAGGGPHYFRNFYVRRALRILPVYYGLIAFFAFVVPLLHPTSPSTAEFLHAEWWFWLHLVNFMPIFAPTFHDTYWLGHVWSLSLEEQFYLVWPIVVLRLSERGLLRVCAGCAVVALGLRVALAAAHVSDWVIYYMPFTRMDTLVAGAALAVVARRPGGLAGLAPAARRWGPVAAVVFAALFITQEGFARWDGMFRTVGYSAAVVTCSAVMVMAIDGPLGRPLSSPVLRWFGRYSYGMYVFHGTLLARMTPLGVLAARVPLLFGSGLLGEIVFFAGGTAVISGVAYASWHLYEKRFLALKRFVPRVDPPPVPGYV